MPEHLYPFRQLWRFLISSPKGKEGLLFMESLAIVPSNVGMWLSLVEYSVRDAGVAGSNPAIPTR